MRDTVPKGAWCQRLVEVVEERKESSQVEEDFLMEDSSAPGFSASSTVQKVTLIQSDGNLKLQVSGLERGSRETQRARQW